jgi:hypothetical protein
VLLPEDIAWLTALVEQSGAAMVVVDVLAAYLSDQVDTYKDQSVRRLLATLGAAAARSGAVVLLIRHHNKAPGAPPIYRGGGSIGIVGAARAAYAVVRDPDDAGRRLLATVKCNLAVEGPTWATAWWTRPTWASPGWNGTTALTPAARPSCSPGRSLQRCPKL